MSHNPVHCEEGKWYFWDETWADRHGPFDSEKEAKEECQRYGIWLVTGVDIKVLEESGANWPEEIRKLYKKIE